ncbi:NRDE family protein [Flavihumibacter stibioxidans]|uniref:Transport and Golgi organization protein 2 n=1 Tax=Flavihumibacter stibioxidans TaxID=1834163 RepID=A0ABR7M4B0_9BACT|nr:NRDE family protein [Flavihumibacter stibioxidans]MBC6489859.1 hypothetical protein [Flavihumibacter stibioxidans]
MCTVTYLPTDSGVLITSNRDEKIVRSRALPPASYEMNGHRLVFPRDPDAAGTWITMKENGQMAVLLNGGWQKHEPVYPYRKSRGLVFLDIAATDNLFEGFESVSLENIEPFTIVLFQDGMLQENRWDGSRKHSRFMDASEPQIWSSVTLYSDEVIRQRKDWFHAWLLQHPSPDIQAVRSFHLFGGAGDEHNGIRMNRNNEMLTVSITSMEKTPNTATMFYTDLLEDAHFQVEVSLTKVPVTHS